ncbi:MAG TPA: BamA/TamA family outer membrane protein, partial [Saprospiraceae bacterium]|nr:BamA/TamA family outer membrane protein [Saprospiraceae bacterium]
MLTCCFIRSFRWVVPALCIACLAACTGTLKLKEGERLYTGAKVKLTKADDDWDIKILKKDLKKTVILPRPNKKILWMRPGLSIYHTFHNRREKSFGNFVATRFGQEPVLYNAQIANRHLELIEERAANDGFFKVKTDPEELSRKHSVKIVHRVRVEAPRKLVTGVKYPSDSTELSQAIAALQSKSLVKAGQPYHLEELIFERQRIADTLRNHGWYYFSPDNLLFEADTALVLEQGELHLTLTVKKEVDSRERRRYRLGAITVYPDYDLAKHTVSDRSGFDTLPTGCLSYVYKDLDVRRAVLDRQIFLRCGAYFSNDEYQSTIFRLLNLNLHKFINIRFEPSAQSDSLLDVTINLTPYLPERVEGTLSGVFSPGFYSGVRAGASYNHRNLFHGAETFRIGWTGAYLRTNNDNFDYDDFLISDVYAKLSFPRFLLLRDRQTRTFNTTQFSLRHEVNYFNYNLPELGKFGLSFQRMRGEGGYSWKKNRRGSSIQEFNPLSLGLQYSDMSDQSLKQQLISGIPEDTTGTLVLLLTFVEYLPNYTFTIDQRLEPARRRTIYFRQRFAGQISGYTPNEALPDDYDLPNPLNFFVESDYRQYQRTHGRNVLAMRLAAAAGIPLKKNSVIALLDRYAFGGASSVRAFPPRSVGPGVQPRDTSGTGLGVGLYTGNVLLEGSIEYRMPIGKYPELAFFVDAGNVWLTSGPDASDATQFKFNRFYKELASGAGMGLRVNLG